MLSAYAPSVVVMDEECMGPVWGKQLSSLVTSVRHRPPCGRLPGFMLASTCLTVAPMVSTTGYQLGHLSVCQWRTGAQLV